MPVSKSRFELNPNFEPQILRSTNIKRILDNQAPKVAAGARNKVPVRTGHLKDSIDWDLTTEDRGLIARIYATDFKAPWYEFGTARKAAVPYLGPALADVFGGLA
jgi:hypothetical protein